MLGDPNYSEIELVAKEVEEAGRTIGRQILIVKAASERDFNAAFATIVQADAGGLLVGGGPFFNSQRRQIVALAARHALPASYVFREYVEAGGLMSYGASQTDGYRRAGSYVGRILNGAKPADMPVELASKFELVINLADRQGARTCGAELDAVACRRGDRMKRREFIVVLGGAAALPFAARAQQAMPVVAFMHSGTSAAMTEGQRAAFREGMKEAGGYAVGQNVATEFHWAEGKVDRLPALAADLVRRNVNVIAAVGGPPSNLAAKNATTTIPVVFITGADPVKIGLVSNVRRPGGNVTGITFFARSWAQNHSACCASWCRAPRRSACCSIRLNLETPRRAADADHRPRRSSGFSWKSCTPRHRPTSTGRSQASRHEGLKRCWSAPRRLFGGYVRANDLARHAP